MRRFLSTFWVWTVFLALLAASQPVWAERNQAVGAARIYNRAVFSTPGQVNALIPLSDGRLLAAGRFNSIGGMAAPRSLALLGSGGQVDPSFQVDESLQVDRVTAAALQTNGKIVIAGSFNVLPDPLTYYLLRLNSNGSLDTTFYDWAVNSPVYAVLLDGNRILIGGSFTTPTPRIARLNADGTADPTFNGLTSGPNDTVRGIARQSSGKYLIAGDFSQVNGTDQIGLARLEASGALDSTFAPGGYRPSTDVAVLADDSVIVGGENICGDDLFAWYSATGALKPTLSTDPNMLQAITTLLPLPDGGFLIGGWYSGVCIGSSPTAHEGQVWRYAADGSYQTMATFGDASDVLTLARRSDGKVVVGGQGRPESAGYIGMFDGLALLDLINQGLEQNAAFHPFIGDEAQVRSISVYPNGSLLAAGDFSHVNGSPRYGLARLASNGNLDMTFAPFADQPGAWSNAALALPDGRAVAGFAGSNLYLLGSGGSLISDLSAFNNYDQVSTLALQPDGKVLVGSDWGLGLRRLAADFTGLDPDFTSGDAYGNVYTVVVQSDQKILVGGNFTSYNGDPMPGLVRLNENGSIDETFIPPAMMLDEYNPATIYTLASLPGQAVLVGGNLQTANGAAHSGLVRLTSTGALDAGFNAPADLHTIKSVCLPGDGSLWVGGNDNTFARHPLTLHLDATGQVDASFASQFRAAHNGGSVNTILCSSAGLTWAGGQFSLIDARFFPNLAFFQTGEFKFYLPLVLNDFE